MYDPSLWDLDTATYGDALHARLLCTGSETVKRCPRFEACSAEVEGRVDVASDAERARPASGEPATEEDFLLGDGDTPQPVDGDRLDDDAEADSSETSSASAPRSTAGNPRCQIIAGRMFTHSGTEMVTDRQLLTYIHRLEGQRKNGGDPEVDPLEAVQDSPTDTSATADSGNKILRALAVEVDTVAGVQFAFDLGA